MLMFVGMTVGGSVGWWAAEEMGFELMGAFLISSVGSLVGVFVIWKVMTTYME